MVLSVDILTALTALLPLFVDGHNLDSLPDPLVRRGQLERVSPKYNHDFEFPLPIMPVKQPLALVLLFLIRGQ